MQSIETNCMLCKEMDLLYYVCGKNQNFDEDKL